MPPAALGPSWSDLPEGCRLRVLHFLGQEDRLSCRLVSRWWAQAPLTELSVAPWHDNTPADSVASSLLLLVSRLGLCDHLRGFRFDPGRPELSRSQYSAILLLLARAAPALSFLSLNSMRQMDAPTLTACMRVLAQLRHLQHLFIRPPVEDVSCLSLLPHLRTLHFGESLGVSCIFRSPHPLPALRTVIADVGCCAHWRHLPNLSHLDTFCGADDEPVLLAPLAASLRTLLLWHTPPSHVVPADLPRLEALQCSPETFMHLPALPSVSALELNIWSSPLPLPDPVVDKAASMPALAKLVLCVSYGFKATIADVNHIASLQRRLCRCSISLGDPGAPRRSLEDVDNIDALDL